MRRTRRTRTLALLTVATACFGLLACAPPPPVHPGGPDCTWPETLDPDRDDLAVLQSGGDGDLGIMITLLHVPSGTIRARCDNLYSGGLTASFDDTAYSDYQSLDFSALGPDLHYGITPTGVIDMHTGALTLNPDPRWPVAALLGNGAVLRFDNENQLAGTNQSSELRIYCVAPRIDAPQSECRALDRIGPGHHLPHADGTVGWAPAVPVPVTFTGPAGRTSTGVIQTDGTHAVQVRTEPTDGRLDGLEGNFPFTRDSGLLTPSQIFGSPVLGPGLADHPAWYTIDAHSATGTLHVSPRSLGDISARIGLSDPVVRGSAVVDDGAALIAAYATSSNDVAIVRIGEDGTATELARLALAQTVEEYRDPASDTLADSPGIVVWPDTTGPDPA